MKRDFSSRPSEETVELAKQKVFTGGMFFLEARITTGDVLIINIWKQLTLRQNEVRTEADGIYWINREARTWGGYWKKPEKLKQSKAMFSNFIRKEKSGDWRYGETQVYARELDEQVILKYIGNREKEVESAIDRWQNEIQASKREESYNRMFERIDAVMDTIPELPEDWKGWLANTVFSGSRYIFFRTLNRKEQVYRCEVCGQIGTTQMSGMKFHHNDVMKCPVCGAQVIAKGWHRQKYLDTDHDVVLYQRASDERLVARKFWVKKKMRLDGEFWKAEIICNENRRDILNDKGVCVEYYEKGTHIPTSRYRWLHGNMYLQDWRRKRIVYEKNLMEVLGGLPQIGHVDLPDLFAAGQGIEVDHEAILRNIDGFEQIEYLQKAGLNRLARECAELGKKYYLLNASGKTAEDFLQLDRNHIDQLRRVCGGVYALQILQEICDSGEKLDDESVIWCLVTGVDIGGMKLTLTGLSLQRMVNYTMKQLKSTKMKYQDWIQMYGDYLEMARKRGMDLSDDIVRKNPRMRYFHDMYVEEDVKKDIKKKCAEKERKYKKIKKDAKRNADHFNFEKDGYVITAASCASDIVAEGRKQQHCVGAGETYFRRMNDRETFILFLRRKKEPQIAYYTLEVRWDGYVVQAYGAYDRKPDWGKVEKLLRSFKKEVQDRCIEEEKESKCAGMTVIGQEAFNRLITAAG